MKHDIVIVGGGASGTAAAIAAHDMGADCAIVECGSRILRKVLSTGNGRCNISNININLARYHSSDSNFSGNVLARFGYKETEDFFLGLGLPLTVTEDGKVFPMSFQASSVVDILRLSLSERNIPVYTNYKVIDIINDNGSFTLKLKHIIDNSAKNPVSDASEVIIDEISCNKLILACGGKSAPKTGSDGSGFMLASYLGHSIIDPLPALVQLKLDYKNLKAITGIKFQGNAEIREYKPSISEGKNNKHSFFKNIDLPNEKDYIVLKRECGEILFTDYGISGPPILQLSRTVSEGIFDGKALYISIDLMPNLSFREAKSFIENHLALLFERSVYDSLNGIINKKLISILLKDAGVQDIHKICSYLTFEEKANIISLIKGWTFRITGTNSFSDSQVTAGGVNTTEVNPENLSSKLIPNLYFAGEILDVDGDCGGFNLQWAWATGYICGKSCAESLLLK